MPGSPTEYPALQVATRHAGTVAQQSGTEPAEVEPDYRYTLANERTYLAWVRTALALIAGGIALKAISSAFRAAWLAHAVGFAAALLGAALPVIAYVHWKGVQRAMRRGDPLPVQRAAIVLTSGIVLLAGILAIAILL